MDIILVTNKPFDKLKIDSINKVTSDKHSFIYTGLDASASKNRNYGLSQVISDIFIMMDDDIEGFYDGWVEDLTKYMKQDKNIIVRNTNHLVK